MTALSARQEEILKIIKMKQHVKVRELSQHFNVSQETIRRDFDRLEELDYITRSHGAATYKASVVPKVKLEVRSGRRVLEKEAIAEVAAALINDNDVISVISSSTTFRLAPWLREKNHLILLTNDIQLGITVSENPSNQVIFLGGEYRPNECCTWGDDAVETMSRFYPDKAFFSITGVSLENGLTSYSIGERNLIRKVLRMSRKSYVMADSTKFNTLGVYYTCQVGEVSAVITDWGIEPKLQEGFKAQKINLLLAEKPSN